MENRKPRASLEPFNYPEHQCPFCDSIDIRVTGNTRRINSNVRKREAACKACSKRFVMVMTISKLIAQPANSTVDS